MGLSGVKALITTNAALVMSLVTVKTQDLVEKFGGVISL
jgi:hypothetical protein